MKKFRTPLLILTAATLAACGSNFEWFPKVEDTAAPVITATISGKTIFNNSTTHVSTLPANVTFSATEAATIYYTTNGTDPTTASASIAYPAQVTGPSITLTDTILKFFGIDKSASKNSSTISSGTIKSP
ncbi:MAG: hypothetical protein FIA91_01830 [Geobacter sp.]|nr:hypothetical protein [Geobacter sp.]